MAATSTKHILCIYWGPNDGIIIRSLPTVLSLPTGYVKTGQIVEVETKPYKCYYKLSNCQGYINNRDKTTFFAIIPSFTPVSIKCICTGSYEKCIIRDGLTDSVPIGIIQKNEIVKIYDTNINGYYKLFDREGFIPIIHNTIFGSISWQRIEEKPVGPRIIENFYTYNNKQLKELCKKLNIRIYDTMTKKDLIHAICLYYKMH